MYFMFLRGLNYRVIIMDMYDRGKFREELRI